MKKNKPKGYWQNWENIKLELEKVIKELGHFPSEGELSFLKKSSLSFAIKSNGGFKKVKNIFGYHNDKKENGYWHNPDNTLKLAKRFYQEYGRLPVQSELTNRDDHYKGLNLGILNFGGINKVAEALNLDSNKNAMNYWKDFQNIQKEVEIFLRENPEFESLPSQRTLFRLGYATISSSITKYHGGFHQVREKLKLENVGENVPKNRWKDLYFTLEEARKIMESNGFTTLPTKKTLTELGYSNLGNAITRYHGGTIEFRILLGENETRKKANTWRSLDYTLDYAKNVLENNPQFETLPSAYVLRNSGEDQLVNAICKYHGGVNAFREKLQEHLGQSSEENKLEDMLNKYAGGKDD